MLFPYIGDAEYLVGYWFGIGLIQSGSMGAIPLTSVEIQAWEYGSGVELAPWEFSAIREMSRAYVSSAHESENESCPAPFGDTMTEERRKHVANRIGIELKALANAKTKSKPVKKRR